LILKIYKKINMKNSKRFLLGFMLILILFLIIILIPDITYARPGGGSHFSGGGGHFSHSSSYSSSHSYGSYGRSSDELPWVVTLLLFGVASAIVLIIPAIVAHLLKRKKWPTLLLSLPFSLPILFGYIAFGTMEEFSLFQKILWYLFAGPIIYFLYTWMVYPGPKKKMETISSKQNPANKEEEFQEVNTILEQLHQLKQQDPNFSRTLLLDFLQSLYYEYYALRGNVKQINKILPFFEKNIFDKANTDKGRYEEIVIGHIQLREIQLNNDYTSITLDFISNYTRIISDKKTRYLIEERWLLNRKAGVQSLPPEKMKTVRCPNCGANEGFDSDYICNHCKTIIPRGEMQWFVKKTAILKKEVLSYEPGEYTEEVGIDYPTVSHPQLEELKKQFIQLHQNNDFHLTWKNFEAFFKDQIVKAYFLEIYKAWSENNLENIRHLISENLFNNFKFWISLYQEKGVQNKLEKIDIQNIEITSIEIDKYYESITTRIFASCLDYMINKEGKVVAGSKKRLREFTEYWTFVRRISVDKQDSKLLMRQCPSCGAPIESLGQSYVCPYCGALIHTDEFSWILSTISQDEVYSLV
jgi:predicted RNA-binding Zn-ribbon protein involved in translation (DUF1610 family)